ncbi:decaprenyl-phosphate phosphoribosyltransferase [Cohnella sp. WQ 127256]|uniref:decaprenyl-phosphate phosphoribosyltransferase n=1 Tax=Cohnella sp. WQ 127256 TaxID=2938790 RepID=UPI0021179067|nr:decaprenyl-phosphate phosphoribosyltransferase [Cohnella sp. WQ 127256]
MESPQAVHSSLDEKGIKVRPFDQLLLIIEQLRVKQWTKNLLIFAAAIFSIDTISSSNFAQVFVAFLMFCFVSSCVYILNDYVDREADRNHPTKRFRPMASGALSPSVAITIGVLLFVTSVAGAFYLSAGFGGLLLLYFVLNIAYSFKLKHIVLFDIMTIAFGFVLRAIAGGVVIEEELTPWFLLCIMLISLFLAISKRRHEVNILDSSPSSHRKVLDQYSSELINQMSSIVTTATIICYSLFTFTSGHSLKLMWTIPLVIYGIFRYLYLIHVKGSGGSPEKILFEDKPILMTVALYGLLTTAILFYYG